MLLHVSGHDIAVIVMLRVAGVTVVACLTAVACIQLWQAFLLLLASSKFLMVSCCWSLCYCNIPGVTNGVVGVSAAPFEHAVAGGPALTGFPAVDSVLELSSVPGDPGVVSLF
jgi:hypothetical protein